MGDHKQPASRLPREVVFKETLHRRGGPPRSRDHKIPRKGSDSFQSGTKFFHVRNRQVIIARGAAKKNGDLRANPFSQFFLKLFHVRLTIAGLVAARHDHASQCSLGHRAAVVRGHDREIIMRHGIRKGRIHHDDFLRACFLREQHLNGRKPGTRGDNVIRADLFDGLLRLGSEKGREPMKPSLDPGSHQKCQKK